MKTSDYGINLLKRFEGFRNKAYKCLASEKYYTIGYGHYGADVKPDMVISNEQGELLLRQDLVKYEDKVNKYSSYNFNQNQFDALVSFCYNIGNIDGLTKKGTRTINEISKAFLLYNKSGGVVIKGLADRRKEEKALFDKPIANETNCVVNTDNSFYPKCSSYYTSIVDGLKSIGVDSTYSNRKRIAIANGIDRYMGFGSQNVELLNKLKEGKLVKI